MAMLSKFELYMKAKHYINRFRYGRKRNMLPEVSGGVAACGQDKFIAGLLDYKRNGVFVDVGANDGVTISNSYYFEKELGWTGVAIEPMPTIFEKLKANRSCDVVQGCITLKAGKAKFVELVGGPNMLSTLAEHDQGLTARRLVKNSKRHNIERKEIEVDCFTFASVTEKYNIKNIDFLSVDTEGGELNILKSINFDKTPVKVISVENNYYDNEIKNYLEGQGFIAIGTFKVDEIYLFGGKDFRKAVKK